MLKKNIQQMKTKAGTGGGKHAQNKSNESNNSSLSKSGRKGRKATSVQHIKTTGGKTKQTVTPTGVQNKKSKDITRGGGKGVEKTKTEAGTKVDSKEKENMKKRSARQKVKTTSTISKEEVTQAEEVLTQASSTVATLTAVQPAKKRTTTPDEPPPNRRRSKRKPAPHQHDQHVKQYFANMTASKREKRIKTTSTNLSPATDKMPMKLKEIRKRIEERTCARTRKKIKDPLKTAIEDDFDGALNFENNGKLFDEKRNPFWTEKLFDSTEAEQEGTEVEGRLTSEHVIKYLEGTLAPIKPTTAKIAYDWTKPVDDMKSIDDAYFNDDAIMYHTLQNIIVHSERAVKRCTQDECCDRRRNSRSKSSDSLNKTSGSGEPLKSTSSLRFHIDRIEQVVYDRDKPIESIQRYLKKRENLQKWDALERYSCYL